MLSRLLSRLSGSASGPTVGPRPVIAIGDIHGRLDLLTSLLLRLERELKAGAQLLFLGDYIDRGPASAGVIDRLIALAQERPDTVFLRGNHEQVLIDLLEPTPDPRLLDGWLTYGGRETLASYGVGSRLVYSDDSAALQDAVQTKVPYAHRQFLARTAMRHEAGDYLFVHAGVDPYRPLDDQRDKDLLWIREPFLSYDQAIGPMVVHGHSISKAVEERAHRIGIDTGAYATGKLTALVLDGQQRRIVQTSG
jgi:serine/threonine protein phosphatase 1